jgi:hypothetical protein
MTKRMPITTMFLKKANDDVCLIKKWARVVVIIGVDLSIRVCFNDAAKINVIGIIGPGRSPQGYIFREALLEEIGIGSSRPYHKGKVPVRLQKEGKPIAITYRYAGFSLNEGQYRAAALIVFGIIQQLADERVAGWRSGGPDEPYYLPGGKYFYSKAQERLVYRTNRSGTVPIVSGARFSASLEGFFARDVFWAGLAPVSSFARLINLRLEHRLDRKPRRAKKKNPLSRPRPERGKKDISELVRGQEVRRMIRQTSLPKWLLPSVVLCLPGGDKNRFASFLRQVLGWQEKTTPEWEAALKSLPGQAARLKGIRMLLRTGADSGKKYVVFEVLPGWNYLRIKEERMLADDKNPPEDIPF